MCESTDLSESLCQLEGHCMYVCTYVYCMLALLQDVVAFFVGTGSGIGTKVLELLQDGYPEVYR